VGLSKGIQARRGAGRRSALAESCRLLLAVDWKQAWAFYGELFGWQKAEFNVGAAVKRVKAGDGQVLRGPTEVLDGNWIVQCADPQGAMFALIGQRGLGYFERVDQVGKRPKITSR
jgi:hypothetical protein